MIKIDPIKNIYPDVVALFFLFMVLFSSVTNAQGNLVTYSENQALAGEEIYESRCANCHGYNLEGYELAPSLSGNFFSRRWGTFAACRQMQQVCHKPK